MSLVCLFVVDSNRLVWEFVRIRQTEIWNLLTGPVNSLIKCCCFSLLNSTSAILLLFHFEDENFFVALSTRRFVHKTIREGNLVSSVFRSTFTYLINALRFLAFCFLRFAKFSSLVLLLNVHLLHPILVYSILHIYWFYNFSPLSSFIPYSSFIRQDIKTFRLGSRSSSNNKAVHRGVFCQFLFRWIYYCHSSKSTGK